MPRPENIPPSVRDLATRLAEPRPMRRGSLSERSMKCGQAGCRCQHDPQARHGPYLSLTRVEAGKTKSRYVGAAPGRSRKSTGGSEGETWAKCCANVWETTRTSRCSGPRSSGS